MNLRVTPSFNTQQIQNKRQNPNFGMVKCSDRVIGRVAKRLDCDLTPFKLSDGEIILRDWMNPEQIAQLKKYTRVYYTSADLRAIAKAKNPFRVAVGRAERARRITLSAVDRVASKLHVRADERRLELKRRKGLKMLEIKGEVF